MTGKWQRLFFLSPLLLIIGIFYNTQVYNNCYEGFYYPILILSFLGFCSSIFFLDFALCLIGISFCVMPFFGKGSLSFFLCCILLGAEIKRIFKCQSSEFRLSVSSKFMVYGFLFLLLAIVCSSFRTFLNNFDFLILNTVYSSGGIPSLIVHLFYLISELQEVLNVIFGILLAFVLALFLLERQKENRGLGHVLSGLAIGSIVSFIIFICQYFEVSPLFSLNRTEFWLTQDRYPSSFGDPNAFAIMSLMLIPILALFSGEGNKTIGFLAIIALLFEVVWAGSRAFLFGMTMVILLLLNRYPIVSEDNQKPVRFIRRNYGTPISLLLLVLIIAFGYPKFNSFVSANIRVSALKNVLETVSWNKAKEIFSNRSVFAEVAISLWKKYPLTGVGLQRFNESQAVAASDLGLDLSSFRENYSNFYLYVLAEQGLLGFFLFLCSFIMFWLSISGSPASTREIVEEKYLSNDENIYVVCNVLLFTMGVMLFTGLYLFHDEVRYLFVVILTFGMSVADSSKTKKLLPIAGLLLYVCGLSFPVAYAVMHGQSNKYLLSRGLYKPEYTENYDKVVWTTKKARFMLCKDPSKDYSLSFKSLEPNLEQNPLNVFVYSVQDKNREKLAEVQLNNNDWKQQEILKKTKSKDSYITPVTIEIETDRVWNPFIVQYSNDNRWLGVMIKYPEDICR